jgi:hypothetical protein
MKASDAVHLVERLRLLMEHSPDGYRLAGAIQTILVEIENQTSSNPDEYRALKAYLGDAKIVQFVALVEERSESQQGARDFAAALETEVRHPEPSRRGQTA